jgi:hypothetical protein
MSIRTYLRPNIHQNALEILEVKPGAEVVSSDKQRQAAMSSIGVHQQAGVVSNMGNWRR